MIGLGADGRSANGDRMARLGAWHLDATRTARAIDPAPLQLAVPASRLSPRRVILGFGLLPVVLAGLVLLGVAAVADWLFGDWTAR